MRRRTSLLLAGSLTTVAVLAAAGPAHAHVTVNPNTAAGGAYTKLTFRVPTESDTASTTRLAVYFPADHPFASASVKPHPGWRFKVVDHKLAQPISSDDGQVTEAVGKIVWTATSAASAIKPGEFDEFDVSVGPLPDTGTLVFKALQTYSDHSVVRWIDPTVAGQAEPEHPAPVLTITPSPTPATAPVTGEQTTAAATPAATTVVERKGGSAAALALSIIALVVALGGAALGVVRRRA